MNNKGQSKSDFDPKKFLLGIFSDSNYKVDREKHPNIQFFGLDKEGNHLFEYNDKRGYFYLSYPKIWSVLEKEMKWSYQQIQAFTKEVAEEHFKLKGVIMYCLFPYLFR